MKKKTSKKTHFSWDMTGQQCSAVVCWVIPNSIIFFFLVFCFEHVVFSWLCWFFRFFFLTQLAYTHWPESGYQNKKGHSSCKWALSEQRMIRSNPKLNLMVCSNITPQIPVGEKERKRECNLNCLRRRQILKKSVERQFLQLSESVR